MKAIFLLLFPDVFSYSYFDFDVSKINLTERQFIRWIRPQTRKIIYEFYSILKNQNPLNNELIQSKDHILKLNLKWSRWEQECVLLSLKCHEKLKQHIKSSHLIDKKIITLQNDLFKSVPPDISGKTDSRLILSRQLDQMANLNHFFINSIQMKYLMNHKNPHSSSKSRHSQLPLLSEMLIVSESTITGMLDKRIKNEFDFIWFHFIKELERHVYLEKKKNYLIDNLEHLNIAWNSFNMKISKGGIRNLKNIRGIVKTMHRRWNSILKIILKNR